LRDEFQNPISSFDFVALLHHTNMPHLDANTKHAILLEYQPHTRTHSFAALARRHGVAGGSEVIRRWHSRWDGTAVSLKEGKSTGRPRMRECTGGAATHPRTDTRSESKCDGDTLSSTADTNSTRDRQESIDSNNTSLRQEGVART
jgi:hypothetical protein